MTLVKVLDHIYLILNKHIDPLYSYKSQIACIASLLISKLKSSTPSICQATYSLHKHNNIGIYILYTYNTKANIWYVPSTQLNCFV